MADRRGRAKAGLSRDKVLDAALAYVDAHGVAALSMRKLGAELGVEAMTLYHYVPNKDAVLDGLVERVLDLAGADLDPGAAHWTDWLRGLAVSTRDVLRAHPGVLPVIATRPVNSPQALRVTERGLAVLRAAGLGLGEALDVFNAVFTFVIGHTLAEVGRTPGHEGGEPDLDQRADELDPAEFPNLVEVVRTRAGLDFDGRFRRTLDILLTGFAG